MKRMLSILTAAALVGGVFSAAPVHAQDAPVSEVPEEPNITDPQGDANHHSTVTGASSPGSLNGADILAIWFTSDAENVYTHIQTTNDARLESVTFIITVDPNKGSRCLQLRTTTGGNFNDPFASVNLTADCGEAGTTELGEVTEAPGPDETSILTSAFPKKDVPLLADGTALKAPSALVGHNGQQASPRVLIIDDTEEGTDYTVEGGKAKEPKEPKKPKKPKPPKKAKKNACKKLEGKAKKKCLKKQKTKTKACAPYKPGELGAEAETVTVTDAATAEKPLEQEVTLDASVADLTQGQTAASFDYFNVQVDSKAKEAGLNVLFEFPTRNDYDLNLFYPDGSYGARSRAWNTIIELNDVVLSETGHGGESTASSEKLVGIQTADCGGWTVEAANFLGQGGTFAIKVWLDKVENEPLAPGEETP